MNTTAMFKYKSFQVEFEDFAAEVFRNINEMSEDELLIYKAQISLSSFRAGNITAVMDLKNAIIILRTRMSDYRFRKALAKIGISKKNAMNLMGLEVC